MLDIGLYDGKTYLQSGNVVITSDLDEASLQKHVHDGFFERFGFQCTILIRTIGEIQFLIEQLPFTLDEIAATKTADPHAEHLYVYFLENPPELTNLVLATEDCLDGDLLRAGKREICLLCHHSIRKSKVAARLSKAYDAATVRNWNTVCKIDTLLSEL